MSKRGVAKDIWEVLPELVDVALYGGVDGVVVGGSCSRSRGEGCQIHEARGPLEGGQRVGGACGRERDCFGRESEGQAEMGLKLAQRVHAEDQGVLVHLVADSDRRCQGDDGAVEDLKLHAGQIP